MNELELLSQLEQKQAEYTKKYDAYPVKTMANGESARDIPASDVEGLRLLMKDVNDIGAQYEEARKAREMREGITDFEERKNTPVNRIGVKAQDPERKDLVSMLMDSPEFKAHAGGKFSPVELDIDPLALLGRKNLFMTTDGYAPEVIRDSGVVPAIVRPPQFIDFLRVEPTTQNAFKFMKQTVAAAQAAPKGEGQAAAEATIEYAEVDGVIRRISVYLPVTDEQLDDVSEMRSLLDNDLRRDVMTQMDYQLTVGSGTGNNLTGAYNASSALTQARSTDAEFDQIMKAVVQLRKDGRVNPNLVLMHISNAAYLTLTRTTDGVYILGNPSDAPLQRVWGLPIAYSEALTLNTGMVLDTNYLSVKLRKGLTVESSNSHADYFAQFTTAIRAEMRAGFKIQRDQAICKLTALRSV